MKINRTTAMYNTKQQSFKALQIRESNIKEAGDFIFNGVRHALMPKEGKLFSDIQELAQHSDIYIYAYPPTSISKNHLNIDVTRGNVTVRCDEYKTDSYKTEEELGEAIDKKVKEMLKSASNTGRCLLI